LAAEIKATKAEQVTVVSAKGEVCLSGVFILDDFIVKISLVFIISSVFTHFYV
jgi:hypothetical protein